MKKRKLIGLTALDEAITLIMEKRLTIATVVKLLEIDQHMHYRTAYDIIKADMRGLKKATRPNWLEDTPVVQESPPHWFLHNGLTLEGYWESIINI
jgi:hypothetical protein